MRHRYTGEQRPLPSSAQPQRSRTHSPPVYANSSDDARLERRSWARGRMRSGGGTGWARQSCGEDSSGSGEDSSGSGWDWASPSTLLGAAPLESLRLRLTTDSLVLHFSDHLGETGGLPISQIGRQSPVPARIGAPDLCQTSSGVPSGSLGPTPPPPFQSNLRKPELPDPRSAEPLSLQLSWTECTSAGDLGCELSLTAPLHSSPLFPVHPHCSSRRFPLPCGEIA